MNPEHLGDATLYTGDVLSVLAGLPEDSVHTVVTSPPYWGLRDYGTGQWEGGSAECDHRHQLGGEGASSAIQNTSHGTQTVAFREVCGKCGARRIDAQIGLESTPEEYVAKMVEVFRAVRRVLRKDGTCWINLGDSYAGSGKGPSNSLQGEASCGVRIGSVNGDSGHTSGVTPPPGLKAKDLVGIPWRVAFALQADGWYLRSEVIWNKPNPMPESVTDRPTKAHEQIFLLAKGQWKSRVIQFSNLPGERFHLLQHLGANSKPVGFPTGYAIDLAAAIFDLAQLQEDKSLPPFYSEKWQKGADSTDSDFVCGLPIEHRPAIWAARFLMAQATTKEFLCELNSLFVTLPNGDDLLKRWTASSRFDSPHITSDGEGAVTVHYPGQICKVDLLHGSVSISEPKGCVYFYDAEAIREPGITGDMRRPYGSPGANELDPRGKQGEGKLRTKKPDGWATHEGGHGSFHRDGREHGETGLMAAGRNRRTVWTIATEPYPAHFATFPRKLVQPCILAGCPEHACPKCGAPWVKEVERGDPVSTGGTKADYRSPKMDASMSDARIKGRSDGWTPNHVRPSVVTGEHPTCTCGLPAIGGTVLDPFGGSGTTAEVALEYGRRAILIELKPEYVELQKRRLSPVAGRPMLDFAGTGT